MPDEDKTFSASIVLTCNQASRRENMERLIAGYFSFGFENLMTSRAHTLLFFTMNKTSLVHEAASKHHT